MKDSFFRSLASSLFIIVFCPLKAIAHETIWYEYLHQAKAACEAASPSGTCGIGGGFTRFSYDDSVNYTWKVCGYRYKAEGPLPWLESVYGIPRCLPASNLSARNLAVLSISGDSISVSAAVKNEGIGTAEATSGRFLLSVDSEFDESDIPVGPSIAIPTLIPDESVSFTEQFQVPGLPSGQYYLIWAVEPPFDDYSTANDSTETPLQIENTVPEKECNDSCEIGNPTDVLTGAKKLRELDYRAAGVFPLEFVRYYNSLHSSPWSHSFSERLVIAEGTYTVIKANGFAEGFTLTGAADPDIESEFATLPEGGYRYRNKQGETWKFSSDGHLQSKQNQQGFEHTYNYIDDALVSVEDHFGRTLAVQFDSLGNLTSLTTPSGEVFTYEYDASDKLVKVIYPDQTPGDLTDNPVKTYLYQSQVFDNGLTAIIDENGIQMSSYEYDAQGRAVSTERLGTMNHTFTYDDTSTTVVNALGRSTIYHFEEIVGSKRITRVEGVQTALVEGTNSYRTYDEYGHVESITDENGNVTLLGYTHSDDIQTEILPPTTSQGGSSGSSGSGTTGSGPTVYIETPVFWMGEGIHSFIPNYANGLVDVRTEAAGTAQERTITTTWHPDFRQPVRIEAPGKTTEYTYDSVGRVTSMVEIDTTTVTVPYSTTGQRREWSYSYDAATGLLLQVDGPRTDVIDTTTYTYDGAGDVVTTTNALGHVVEVLSRNGNGFPTAIIDENGTVTILAYDAQRRLISSTIQSDLGDQVTQITYRPSGEVSRVTLPNGTYLNYEYDDVYRLTAVENEIGERMEYVLDDAGNVTLEVTKDSLGTVVRSQQFIFDELSRLREILGNNGQNTQLAYDHNNNFTSSLDAFSNGVTESLDALDRVTQFEDAIQGVGTYEYDARDNLIAVTDQRGVRTEYTYDGLDNLIQLDSPDTGITVYQYDAAGNMISSTDARGVVVNMQYDAINRVTAIEYPASPGENIGYLYDTGTDGVGRLTQINDESGSTSYTYNDLGQITSQTATISGTSYQVLYTYDAAGQLSSMTYPSGREIVMQRDVLGRVSAMYEDDEGSLQPLLTEIDYLPFAGLAQYRNLGGELVSFAYDLDYRVTDINNVSGDIAYTYDQVDNITGLAADGASPETFGYDDLYRLETASGDYGLVDYSYDEVGNRLTDTESGGLKTYGYALDSNRLIDLDAAPIVTDEVGNITSKDGNSYVYNHRNRMASVATAADTTTYLYNALGQRVAKSNNTEQVQYVYNTEGLLIAEYSGGELQKEYVYLGSKPVVVYSPTLQFTPEVITLDSEDVATTFVGQWNISTAIAGYLGENYLVHEANGAPPGGIVVDNGDPAFSTTGTWTESTAVAGYVGSNYQHHYANGPSPDAVALDNDQASISGSWNTSSATGGYEGTGYYVAPAGTGLNSVVWSPTVGTTQTYEVFAKWTSHSNRASNAKYVISTTSGDQTITVNQQANGGTWNSLGSFELAPGTTISLSDDANGYVIADAIQVVPNGAAPNTATWSLVADQTDEYFVYVNWTAHPNRASNAQYKITTPAGIQYVDVNQQTSADGWHLLNTVSLNSGDSVLVELTDVANGYVIADAVKMISTTAPPNSVAWELPITGQATYEVYARWTSHPNRADNAEYVIQHAMGGASIVVNQRANSAQWNYLGTYDLNGASSVTISDVANGYVIADAIELRRVSAVSAFEPFAIHTDHLDTPRRVTNAANDEVWAASRLPFGETSVTTEELTLNLRFPGQYFDQETGTHYNYFRDYDPGIGRYVQSDPIGLGDGTDTFGYVQANPVRYVDPRGKSKFDKLYGLPKRFWQWYHRNEKRPGDPDLDASEARELYKEWLEKGQPGPDKRRNRGSEEGSIEMELLEFLVPYQLIPFLPTKMGCAELDCNKNGIPDHEENYCP